MKLKMFMDAMQAIENDRKLTKEIVVSALEEALIKAYRKHIEIPDALVRVDISEKTGAIKVFQERQVVENVEDDEMEISLEDAQRINKNYHAGLTGTDITHENEDHYGFSFTFDENRNADSSEPRAYSTYDYWNGDDQESVEWVVYEVTTDKPFFLLSYEEYESIELTGFYDSFDEAFEEMKELIAESVNDVFDEDATADDVEDMEDYNVFVHSNKDSQDNGAPLAFASFCDDYPNREWTVFHI